MMKLLTLYKTPVWDTETDKEVIKYDLIMVVSDFTNVDIISVQTDHLNGWVAAAALEIIEKIELLN